MAHPYSSHREHSASRSRASHLLKSGGAAKHSDVAADKKLFKDLMAKHEAKEMKVEGKLSHKRMDKYARGGRTKHKPSHQVNIAVVAPGRHPTEGAAPGGPMPMPPPRPPVGAAPGLPPGLPPGGPPVAGGPPGLPPGLGPRPPGMMKKGGRVKMARGGKLGMTAGADTGKGRLQKRNKYGLKAIKKGN